MAVHVDSPGQLARRVAGRAFAFVVTLLQLGLQQAVVDGVHDGQVQTALTNNPFSDHVFVFRGRRGDIIKVLWFDGQGLCLLATRLGRERIMWPQVT